MSEEAAGYIVQPRRDLCHPSASQACSLLCGRASAWGISQYLWVWVVLCCLMCSSLFAHSVVKLSFPAAQAWTLGGDNFLTKHPHFHQDLFLRFFLTLFSVTGGANIPVDGLCLSAGSSPPHSGISHVCQQMPSKLIKHEKLQVQEGRTALLIFCFLSPLLTTTRPERGMSD